jgi:ABC-type multidrug transport system fused ATPase/permease subunit
MQNLIKILFLLNPSQRKYIFLLLFMIIVMALLDTIGVASILPFVTVLSNPSLIETNVILKKMFDASSIFGVESGQDFIFVFGVFVFILLLISIIFKALTTYLQIQFVQMCEFTIGKRLVEGYLRQPYSWFLDKHSAEIGKTVLSEVQQIISSGIGPFIELIAKGIVTFVLISLIIIINPKLSLIVGLLLGGVYGIIFYFTRKYLDGIGIKRLNNNHLRFKAVSEAFSALKEIKISGLEKHYTNLFSISAKIFAETQASSKIISQLPRYILEATVFGGALLLILTIMSQTGSFNNALPIISLYIFAGYRLMPALQAIYASLSQLTFVSPSLNKLYDDIKNLKNLDQSQQQEVLLLNNKITLNDISYNYPNSSIKILKNINFVIPAKSTIGIIGPTGSGKTTLVDIILGLLDVKSGSLEVDGKVITKKNSRSWQKSIGYTPQHIYLVDDTISANIAFGVEKKDINQQNLERASKIANLHEFVTNELPQKYETTIGERGIRLSGGQRQRIGIARALYNNPKVLILDEATNSLDNETEKAVMDAVNNISKSITIILIAHRLNTVKYCDIILKLVEGQIIEKGNFSEIVEKNNKTTSNKFNI